MKADSTRMEQNAVACLNNHMCFQSSYPYMAELSGGLKSVSFILQKPDICIKRLKRLSALSPPSSF